MAIVLPRRVRRLFETAPHRGDCSADERARLGALPVAAAPDRRLVRVAGVITAVTYQPTCGAPRLEARLEDGSGALMLVWLGQTRISGIGPGTRLVAEGRVFDNDGRRTMMDPRYELLPARQAA